MPIPPIINSNSDVHLDADGSFVVGTQAMFFVTFTDIDGQLFDPSDITTNILDDTNTSIKTIDAADQIEHGIYAITWNIPRDATPGKYTLKVDYTAETPTGPESRTFTEDFAILESGQGVVTLRQIATRSFLESLIGYTQRIPVFDEPARLNKAKTIAELSFPRWNQTSSTKVRINGQLIESGYSVDYLKGRILFNNPLSNYDQINVTYNFRWLSDQELDSFVQQGVNIVNIYPPQSVYTVLTIPDQWLIAAEYSAAVSVFRRLLADLLFLEPTKVFGGPKRASELAGQIETLKQNYESELTRLLEQKKYGPYVGLTRTIISPQMTLPGSRCLSADTLLDILIVNEDYQKTTEISHVFDLFQNGKKIKALSRTIDNDIIYETITKIWESGIKTVFQLITKSGKSIKASKEHLFFLYDTKEYVPLMDLEVGQSLLSLGNNNKLIIDEIIEIKEFGECQTYDVEVPSTENLFANKINVHNSRWFRYLFSGGS